MSIDTQKQTKYNEIKNYLLSLISQNANKPNYRLPTELDLAKMFNTSRITSKHAFELLEQEHLIYRVQGSGTFINQKPLPSSDQETSSLNKTIALLIPDLKSHFTTSIVHGVEQTLKQQDYALFLSLTDYNQELEQKMIAQFLDLKIGGFIIYPVDNQIYNTEILKLLFNKFPVVFVDRYLPGISINNVSSSHTHDAMHVVEELIKNGHKKIGIISTSPEGTTTIQRRLNGYERALLSHNLPIENRFMCTKLEHYAPNWEPVISEYLEKNPDLTAIITTGSDIGYKLLKVLKSKNIRVPEDISAVLYDEEYIDILQFMNVNPARLEQNPFQIGTEAAKLILKSIQNPQLKPVSVRIPSKFVFGNTILNFNTGNIAQ